MSDREVDRLRDDEDRERYAIRRLEERLAREEKELEDKLDGLGDDERRAEHDIEAEFRDEHFGRDPERPWTWRDPGETDDPG